MLKFPSILLILLVAFSCIKKQRIVNRLEGSWHIEKRLNKDGSYTPLDITMEFSGGKADGSTFLPVQTTNGTQSTSGQYLITKKGDQMYLQTDTTLFQIDTCLIEDFDSKSMVFRNYYGVFFMYKQ